MTELGRELSLQEGSSDVDLLWGTFALTVSEKYVHVFRRLQSLGVAVVEAWG